MIVAIAILSKNDLSGLMKTLESLQNLHKFTNIIFRFYIFEESDFSHCMYISSCFPKMSSSVYYYDMKKIGVSGIYETMNYALRVIDSDWFCFLNGGDEFTLAISGFDLATVLLNSYDIVFFMALISSPAVSWELPSRRISNIGRWIKYFEPNHQAMFVSTTFGKKYLFELNSKVGADGLWKRTILKHGRWLYVPITITRFHLGGISNQLTLKLLLRKSREPCRRSYEKLAEILKIPFCLTPSLYPFLMKARSNLLSMFF